MAHPPEFGEGNSNRLQYSCLENPMVGRGWWAAVHGVVKSRTRLTDFTFTFRFHALEKERATHSRVLAWRIPGMVEPGGLPSMGSHRVRHDWSDLAAAAAAPEFRGGAQWTTTEEVKPETHLAKGGVGTHHVYLLSLTHCSSLNLGVIFVLHTLDVANTLLIYWGSYTTYYLISDIYWSFHWL